MNKNKFYITTTLAYVNAEPHIGFALEIIRADCWARFMRNQGNDVFFNTGTDEHGQKVFQRAKELGIEPQAFCNELAEKYLNLKEILNLSYDNFIRTTNPEHIKATQEFWKQCSKNGYIYKQPYKIKYCVGCELEKTESELKDGRCPLHPSLQIQIIDEENYFFKFSEFQEKLQKLYSENPEFVVPAHRFNEVKKIVETGPEDFSISRLKTKMPWGVEVPNDKEHVMYVWFDALINYISAIGWPTDLEKFNSWWPAIQVAGKDNIRQQSAMWQAMLMSVGLVPSKQIFINSFITSKGQKMSKSLGNVISPQEMVDKFGTDGTRWILLNLNTFGDDMDLTWEGMTEKYNADLANGLGNLLERVFTLIINNNINLEAKLPSKSEKDYGFEMENFRFSEVTGKIITEMKRLDKYIDEKKPWQNPDPTVLNYLFGNIEKILVLLAPFMPEKTKQAQDYAEKIRNKKIAKDEKLNLFPRM
ncbi:MAG: methionine--tRNA ligase [Candidatus Parcubacteria bacterium]|nr:methionine--tRNA ligase [Candidatus Parcubacteria bacterium]